MEHTQIRIGIIGYGMRAQQLYSHIYNINKNVIFTAVYDPDIRSIEKAKHCNPQIKIHNTYQELCEDPEIQWVLVASWNNFHKEQVLCAFQNGKHVFCEKPLASTLEDCLAMKKGWIDTQKKSKFIIGFVLRFANFYKIVFNIVHEQKLLGKIISLEFNETLANEHGGYIFGDWRRLEEPSGGMLLEKCSHDIDLINWIVGSKVKKVSSFGGLDFFKPENADRINQIKYENAYQTWGGLINKNPFTSDKNIVDNQVAILEFENNVRATFHLNANSTQDLKERRMYICGSHGTLRGNLLTGEIEYQLIGEQNINSVGNKMFAGGHGDGDEIICQSVVDAMFNNTDPQCGIEGTINLYNKNLEGLNSAIVCFGIERARKEQIVFNMEELWKLNK